MPLLNATPKDPAANSYVTVARANEILGRRLYTQKWDNAASTPDAEGYTANGAAAIGATTVTVAAGTGTFTVGSKVRFGSDLTLYTVSTALSAPGNLVFTPGLVVGVSDGDAVERQTLNEKEKALIWATEIFDNMLVYYGSVRSTGQRLRFPRMTVLSPDGSYFDYDTIPEILEIATANFALVLLERNKFKLPGILGQGISQVTMGPISATIDAMQQEAVIPQSILALLSSIGYLEEEAQVGTRIMPLHRM